jgi:hypothetical protein
VVHPYYFLVMLKLRISFSMALDFCKAFDNKNGELGLATESGAGERKTTKRFFFVKNVVHLEKGRKCQKNQKR